MPYRQIQDLQVAISRLLQSILYPLSALSQLYRRCNGYSLVVEFGGVKSGTKIGLHSITITTTMKAVSSG